MFAKTGQTGETLPFLKKVRVVKLAVAELLFSKVRMVFEMKMMSSMHIVDRVVRLLVEEEATESAAFDSMLLHDPHALTPPPFRLVCASWGEGENTLCSSDSNKSCSSPEGF